MKAFLLIKFAPEADLDEAKHALEESEVKSLDLILGAYDAIAIVEAGDLEALGVMATRVRNCPGIVDSVTCPVIA